MARWSFKHNRHELTSAEATAMGLAGLMLCTIVLTMCASHLKRRRRRLNATGMFISNPTVMMDAEPQCFAGRGIHWTHAWEPTADESAVSRELCLWKKNILMGEKCQPPEFSGVIMYDSAGNVIPPTVPRITYPSW